MVRKILIVDDNEMNLRLLRHILSDEYEILEARNGREALFIMREKSQEISAVLLDIIMPVMDGYEVLRQREENSSLIQIPVIVTSINSEEGAEVKALSLGANDYIAKPYNPQIIKKRLENTISLREKAAIVNAIKIDALTGLYTREAFFEKAQELIISHDTGYYVMASFDVEKFKVINDQYGAKKGDEVLRFIADTFRDGFNENGGICCRIMADNFAVLYPTSFTESGKIEEIRNKAAELDGSILPITFSIGRYVVEDMSLSPSAMYDRAVLAKAKVKGRYDKHIAFYNETMRDKLLKEQEIISEMKTALVEKQFEVWYQPQYNHSSGAVIGAEALVRWRHPKKGLISPGTFIPVFERNGFIYELDKYVWEEVCIYLKKRQDNHMPSLPVSVNISRYDIFRSDLAEVIIGLIKKYHLPIEMLRLEVTETAFSKSSEHIISVVKEFKELGFIMEIDDFGSGYSFLNILKDVPADVLKLDMRFLEGEDNTTRGGNIVESIVRMTKWLGMSVIAEGVETKEQADYLESVGCNYIQGYFYARPMPEKELETLLETAKDSENMQALETVETLDNDAFWNPNSIETLIYNSYVGGASVFEYHDGKIEILRVNKKYAQMLGGDKMSMDKALKIKWSDYAAKEDMDRTRISMKKAIETRQEVTDEIVLKELRGKGTSTYLRANMRVIANTGNRYLIYCMIDDITAQREAERKEESLMKQLQLILDNVGSGVITFRVKQGKVETLYANDKYYAIRGYTREQYNNEISNPFRLIHMEERKWVKEKMDNSVRIGRPAVLKYKAFTRDGYEIWIKNIVSSARMNKNEEPIQISIISDITRDKLNEERLQINEERLSYLNKTLNDFMDDAPGGFARMHIHEDKLVSGVFVNNGYCKLLGYTEVYIMRHFCKNAYWGIHPDDIEIIQKNVREMISSHETRTIKYRLLHRGGEYRWYQVYGRISTDEKGQKFINAYFTDISEQVKVEELRRDLIEKLPCGAGIYSFNGKSIDILYINTRYRELVGREINVQKPDITALSAVREDERENLLRILKEAITLKTKCECDIHILHGNGQYIPFHLTGNVEEQEDGKAIIYTTYTPITESELTYKEMIPVVLRAMMASSSDLLFVKDKSLSYIGCSRTFAHMVGLKDETEIVGKTDFDMFEGTLAQKYRDDDHKMFETGDSLIDYEEYIPSKDGLPHYSSTSKYILRDSMNNIIGMYGVGRDITQDKDSYARLKLLTDTLPGGVAMFEISKNMVKPLYVSEGIYTLSNYSKEEYHETVLDDICSLVFAEDRHIIEEQIEKVLTSDVNIDCSFRILPKDREYCWINLKGAVADRYKDRVIVNAVLFDVTVRKNSNMRLEASRKALEIASSNAGISFWLLDINEKKVSFEMFQGKSVLGHQGTISNMPDYFIQTGKVAKEDEMIFKAMYQRLYAGAERSECTVRLLNNNTGKFEWQHTIYIRLKDELYHTRKAIGFAVNVDLEQENKQDYKHELQLRKEMIKNSVFYYQLNLNTNIIEEYHSMYSEKLGMKRNTVLNDKIRNDILDVIALEDREMVSTDLFSKGIMEQYQNGVKSFSREYRRLVGQNGMCWVEMNVSIIEKPTTGEPIAFLLCNNIDRRKKDELAISTIMEEEIESVTMINVQTGVAHLVQVGKEIKELAQRKDFDFNKAYKKVILGHVLEEDQPDCLAFFSVNELKDKLKQEEAVKITFRINKDKKGMRRKKARAFYLDKTEKDIVLIRQDITDLYDEECRQREVLQKAVDSANNANQAKSAFLSNMSHDMRTPLNAVLAFSNEAILNEVDEDKLREYLDKIHVSGEYLLSIINDVLDMSKIEQKKVVLKPEPYSIEEFTTMVNDVIAQICFDKGITFITHFKDIENRSIIIDKVRFNQIFINLLSNAVKFTPKGGKIEFIIERCSDVENNKVWNRFIVRDTGIGMSKDFISHAFESFKQEYHKDLSENNKGTGLGLSIVKELVAMMDGTVKLESEEGKGTTFTILLPITLLDDETVVKEIKQQEERSLKGVRILLVEDNNINTEIATTILRKQGCLVECAKNGQLAVDMFEKSEENYYELILMDIRMPVMNGLEASRAMRLLKRKDAQTIPIIAMSADAFDEDERIAVKAGMNDHISKPVEPQLLFNMIRKYI